MQGFYFFVTFGLVLICIWKVCRKKSSSIVPCSIHYLHFSFEKHVPSQVLKDFSVENLESTRTGEGIIIFLCFPLPPANEHSFNSSRFLPLIFTRSICNYQTGCFIFLQEIGRRITKSNYRVLKYEMIFLFISI